MCGVHLQGLCRLLQNRGKKNVKEINREVDVCMRRFSGVCTLEKQPLILITVLVTLEELVLEESSLSLKKPLCF